MPIYRAPLLKVSVQDAVQPCLVRSVCSSLSQGKCACPAGVRFLTLLTADCVFAVLAVVGFISNTVNFGVDIITAPARAIGNLVWEGVSSLGSAIGALFSGEDPGQALTGLFTNLGNSVMGVTDTLFGWLLGDGEGGGGIGGKRKGRHVQALGQGCSGGTVPHHKLAVPFPGWACHSPSC